jgi:hypothetical protein
MSFRGPEDQKHCAAALALDDRMRRFFLPSPESKLDVLVSEVPISWIWCRAVMAALARPHMGCTNGLDDNSAGAFPLRGEEDRKPGLLSLELVAVSKPPFSQKHPARMIQRRVIGPCSQNSLNYTAFLGLWESSVCSGAHYSATFLLSALS